MPKAFRDNYRAGKSCSHGQSVISGTWLSELKRPGPAASLPPDSSHCHFLLRWHESSVPFGWHPDCDSRNLVACGRPQIPWDRMVLRLRHEQGPHYDDKGPDQLRNLPGWQDINGHNRGRYIRSNRQSGQHPAWSFLTIGSAQLSRFRATSPTSRSYLRERRPDVRGGTLQKHYGTIPPGYCTGLRQST